jgi:predicted anti-sigma-YlaC factor YlaD
VTCREFSEFISDYLSGDLEEVTRARFAQHLTRCANCRRYLTAYEETVKLGKRAFDDPDASLPPDIPHDLIEAILRARRPS